MFGGIGIMKITQKELKLICEELMEKLWNDKLEIPVVISGRMSNSLGLFYYQTTTRNGQVKRTPLKIAISKKLVEHYSLENIEGTIKHELCHYYLYKTGQLFSDGDKVFEDELKRIGSHSTRTLSHAGEIHTCLCSLCGRVVDKSKSKASATRTINNHISACCRADIVYGGMKIVKDTNAKDANYKTKNNISVIHKYVSQSSPVRKNRITNNNIEQPTKLKIEDVVVLGPKGGVSAQVYYALIAAIKEESAEKVRLIAKHYPSQFDYECKRFSKKRMSFINSVLN